jgi:hypothetical protein
MKEIAFNRKSEIAKAIVDSLKYVTHSDGYRRCHYYAHSGAAVLNKLYNESKYLPVYSRYYFRIGWNKGDTVKAVKDDSWSSFGGKYEEDHATYADHCYILGNNSDGRVEIVDFSTHMHRMYWERKWGVSWNWSPDFFWDLSENIPAGYRNWFTPYAKEADEKAYLKGEYDPKIKDEIVEQALWRLAGCPKSEPIPPWRYWGYKLIR